MNRRIEKHMDVIPLSWVPLARVYKLFILKVYWWGLQKCFIQTLSFIEPFFWNGSLNVTANSWGNYWDQKTIGKCDLKMNWMFWRTCCWKIREFSVGKISESFILLSFSYFARDTFNAFVQTLKFVDDFLGKHQ